MQIIDANFVPVSPTQWLGFDEVLLLPQYSNLNSRNDPRIQLDTMITSRFSRPSPIISSNMDTVTEANLAIKMHECGGMGILHRFYEPKYTNGYNVFLDDCKKIVEKCGYLAFSIGCNKEDLNIVEEILKFSPKTIVCIDIAHAMQEQCISQVMRLSQTYANKIDIIAGNVSTPDGVIMLAQAGANAIKIGIGAGSMCSTRLKTGCGCPMISAILHARKAINAVQRNASIICDGGIRYPSDIVKAMAAGASAVCIGRLFAGTYEAAGETKEENGRLYKKYRGQSSYEVNKELGKEDRVASEGTSTWVECVHSAEVVMKDIIGSLRSAMTYQGAKNWDELYKKAAMIQVNPHIHHTESIPHGLLL